MGYHVSEFPDEASAARYADAEETVAMLGKFEGEEPWVVLAYEDYLDGCWKDGIGNDAYAEVDESDRNRWKLSLDTVALVLSFSEQGFVYGCELNSGEYADYLEDMNSFCLESQDED